MRRLGRIVVTLLSVVGLLTLAAVGLAIWGLGRLHQEVEPALPDRLVLDLDLDGAFRQAGEASPLARLSGEKSYVLPEVAAAIDRAAKDSRVKGLFATIGDTSLGMAGVQEIRDAVARFRASGKPAVLFAEALGEGGSGTRDVYLASAFGQVWLQPSGDVGLTGFLAESPFIKGLLDTLGIQPEFGARYQYKSAIDVFTETGFTAAHRENLGALMDSWSAQAVDGIAKGRKLAPDTVRALIDKGPLLASEALAAGLVDKLGYRADALAAAGGGAKPKEVDIAEYAARTASHRGTGIALITGSGPIHRGESVGPLGDEDGIGSATIARAIRDAVADPQIKGIVLRIDSPGGSYVASDTIWHEVEAARAAGKPVVASMGDVAASGGYFMAMAANRVVAEPGTITGSIGVFTGKLVLQDFWPKLGISWDQMHRGDNATIWSMNQPFTPAEWDRVNALLDHIYQDFTAKAMAGRNIPADRIDGLARGRVWSGADAKARGLVDALGGMAVALAEMRQLVHLPADAPLDLVTYPRPKTPLQLLAEVMGAAETGRDDLHAGVKVLQVLAPFATRLETLDPAAAGELRLPDGMVPR